MANRATVDLLTIALELRLAAHDPEFAGRRLTDARLLEMADVLEAIAHRDEPGNQNAEVRALRTLTRASL